ncbi:GMC family oxidoreductase N-terminal domain-containing protein [Sphingomonas oligophenolica]|uniref:GMC oxidoreductase n=1 Tax=Sphingomonas oligophenolica TaxID=301154 RepID=A0ABU9Y980_9SPHN
MTETAQRFDYVVAGGGTAGCVLAARLSERPDRRVLLVEAGIDTPPGATPADILDPYPLSYANPAYRWPVRGHALRDDQSPAAPLLQARVLGGGSSIMGMIMLRGIPADYDRWAELGAEGWSWEEVLPWFRRLENDLDFDGPLHGRAGPTEIRRHDPAGWPPIARAAQRIAAERGLPLIADMNGDFRDGYGALPIAGTPERRSFSAGAYLTSAVRARPNLEIMTSTMVASLLWDGARVAGVRVSTPGGTRDCLATETLLSMGALLSPHFLLTQGIGAPETLMTAGVAIRHALNGVGRNLQNHAALTVTAHIKRRGLQHRPERNHNNTMIRYSSGQPGCGASDMMIGIGSRAAWHAVAARVAHFAPIVMAPESRGQVTLDAAAGAKIEFNLLGDPRDEARLGDAIPFIADLIAKLQAERLIGTPVPISRFAAAARFSTRNLRNRLAAGAVARITDLIQSMGEAMLAELGADGMLWSDILRDGEARACFVRANAMPLAHHAGTCRMGRAGDPGAVVDSAGRVYGVPGLRVADASVMPTVPRGNTNLPVLMIAEKIAGAVIAAA